MKNRHFILFLFLLRWQDVWGDCITSADYYTYNNFCNLDSVYVTAHPLNGTGPFTYLWATGDTTQTISVPLALGDYLVTITDAEGCSIVINCHVKPTPTVLFYPFNQNACFGDTVTLFLDWFRDSIPGATYLWSTGETTSTILITNDITWSATVTDPNTGCEYVIPPNFFDFHPTPYPEIVGPNIICSGQSIILTVIGGPFGEIVWFPGAFIEDSIEVFFPGTYTVWGSSPEANYCWHQDSIVITEGEINPPILSGPPELCDGQTGIITIDNSNEFYTFLWSNNQSTSSITVTQPGTYTVTVTNDNGCSAAGEYTVDPWPGPSLSISSTASTCGQNNGSVDLTPTPTGNYTFEWSNGNVTEDLINITGGFYEVTVTSPNGCVSVINTIVPDNPIVITLTAILSPNTSCVMNNGGINLSVSPSATYTYLWSNGSNTQDLSNIPAGTYSVTVTIGNSCTATAEYVVLNQSNAPSYAVTAMASLCGEANGSIDLAMNGGTPPFNFTWSDGSNQEDLINVLAGNYTVTITGADGCVTTNNFIIPDSIIPINISGIITPNSSCIGENGMIDINLMPAEIYNFTWSNGETTEDLNNLGEGLYTVTVTLGNTCETSAGFLVEYSPIAIVITGSTFPNSSCSQPNGVIDISIDPVGSYTYIWSNGETSQDLQEVPGGTYSITVIDADGCTGTGMFTVVNTNSTFTIESAITPNTSCNAPSGSIDLTISPSGAYTFTWSDGATTEDINDLVSGNYSVTVTDINNCSSVGAFSIPDTLSFPSVTALITPTTCGETNGIIDLNVSPQNGNLYLWSDGSTTEDLTDVASGYYSVMVTGPNGCITSDTFIVNNQNSNFVLTGVSVANQSCLNPNGTIDLSVSPSATYSFVWSNAAITEDLQNLSAGVYTVTVTDTLNCTSSDTFIVADNVTIPVLASMVTMAVCGGNNGAIDLLVNPVGNNSFQWSNGEMTEDLGSLMPGTYSVIVTDANGCQAFDTIVVNNLNNNFSITAFPVSNTSCTTPNGAIDMSITPIGTYTITWSNGATTEDISNAASGSYTVTVTDSSSCSSVETFVIGDALPVIGITAIINPALCGAGNGNIDITITPSSGYLFSWSNGDINEDVQNLMSGNYSLTVTDTDGCVAADTFTVPALGNSFTLDAIQMANSSCTVPNGAIDLSVIPSGVYTYTWSDGTFNQDLSNLIPGIYTVTVFDPNGCSSSSSYTVADQTILPQIDEIIVPSTCGLTNGQIDITVSPSGLYVFTWSDGFTTEDRPDLSSGTYTITVTSQNGCSASASIDVPNTNSNFSISGVTTVNNSCNQSNGAIDLTVTPSGLYSFIWSTGQISDDLLNLGPGSYIITVTDLSGCSSTAVFIVNDSTTTLLVEETITPGLCGDPNGSIDLAVIPSAGNLYNWSTGSAMEDLENLLPGTYHITITAGNGCTWSSSYSIEGNEKLEITLLADIIQAGNDLITILAEVNLPLTAIDTVIWMPEELFSCDQPFCLEQTITRPDQQTEIIVMALDTNGCLAQAHLTLYDAINPKVHIPNVFSPNGDGINDLITVYGNRDVEIVEVLQIFDRWGNQVFSKNEFPPNEENYGWDGVFKNELMNPAVFAYWVRVRFTDGSHESFKGDVTLIR